MKQKEAVYQLGADELPCPTESVEQQCLFRWVRMQRTALPELAMLYHIPNEGKRSRATGARMKAEGLQPGVPDLCLPVPRDGFHALYIEMKRRKGGRVTDDQRGWLAALQRQGCKAIVCRGWEEAAQALRDYLKQDKE